MGLQNWVVPLPSMDVISYAWLWAGVPSLKVSLKAQEWVPGGGQGDT